MRVVIDTSVVVAALTTPNAASASRVILAAAAAGAIRPVVTDLLEREYRRAVEYAKVVRFAAELDRQAFVAKIVAVAERVVPAPERGAVPADPDDDHVIAAAWAGGAEYVVSLDRHLLAVRKAREVRVVRPGEFLEVLRAMDRG